MEALYNKLIVSLPMFNFTLNQLESIYITFNNEPIALINRVEHNKDNIKIIYKTVFTKGCSIAESLSDLMIELKRLI